MILMGAHKSIGAAQKRANPGREGTNFDCTKHTRFIAESALGGFGYFTILRRILYYSNYSALHSHTQRIQYSGVCFKRGKRNQACKHNRYAAFSAY